MIDNPFDKAKLIGDILSGAIAVGSYFTLSEWAALVSISWYAYRYLDDFYGKWKRSRNKE